MLYPPKSAKQPFALAVLCMVISVANAEDWPTHMHDRRRTGHTSESLKLPLYQQWTHSLPKPKPAWPLPAKQDYWHRKTNLRPRIVHDRANGIVVADGRLIVGSSADDQVRSLDVTSGELLWTTFAEGPIRLAPSVWKSKDGEHNLVVFAADDGYVYGVSAENGKRRWKTRPLEIGPRRIPGNGRIISERPIRSDVMIGPDGTGHFAAGIFPLQGAYYFSMDVRTGTILDRAKVEKSIQGYLEVRDGKIFAPTGRDPHGHTLGGQSKRATSHRSKLDDQSFCLVKSGTHTFYGRENHVVAIPTEQVSPLNTKPKVSWQANVQGRVYSMAVADGRLFVSTDEGHVYAFGDRKVESVTTWQVDSAESQEPSTAESSQEEHPRRYVLFVDPEDEVVQRELLDPSNHAQIVVAVDNEERADKLRRRFVDARVYGRVVVHVVESLDDLPYAHRIFSRVVGGSAESTRKLVSPYRPNGIRPDVEASWTHAYGDCGNKASSNAKIGGSPLKLQWFGGPGPRNMVDRHMRTMPPLVSHGTMYVPGLDRVIAVDAYTGVIAWEAELPGSTRIGMLKDCGWMAAREDKLFVALKNKLLRFSSAEGIGQECFNVPFENRSWGYLACVGQTVIGSSTLIGSHRQTINRDAILEGAYTDNRPVICSDALFAFDDGDVRDLADTVRDTPSERLKWTYKSRGAILNPTIAATTLKETNGSRDSFVFFVENSMDLEATKIGRIPLAEFLNHDARLVALHAETGKRVWSVNLPKIPGAQNAFLLCDHERVVLVNSRNAKTVHYDVRTYRSWDGEELWTTSQDNKLKVGGDHGEQDKHPLIVGDKLVVEPYGYDLDTGHKLTELNLSKRGYGCGTLSASADALFFRSGNPASYSLKSNKLNLVTSVTRPSCWINMIPAEGMLLIPEGSSGCTCNFAVQTSMAFVAE